MRGNQTIVNLKTENHLRAYAETMNALKIDDDGPNIQYKDFKNLFHLFFNLTSTQEANVEMHFPEVVGAGIRLELYFAIKLTNTVELFVSGERISSIAIDKEGSVTKNGQPTNLTCCQQAPGSKVQITGSFPANHRPRKLPTNTFCIINTDPTSQPGSHWTLLANKNLKLFYGDSMGEILEKIWHQ